MPSGGDQRILAALEVLERHERWPVDDELAGWVPVDEVRAALTGLAEDGDEDEATWHFEKGDGGEGETPYA